MLKESESVWSKSCGERDKEFSSLITVIITTLIDSILNDYYGSWFFIFVVIPRHEAELRRYCNHS